MMKLANAIREFADAACGCSSDANMPPQSIILQGVPLR